MKGKNDMTDTPTQTLGQLTAPNLSIEAAGFNNQVTYHSGSPKISKSGESNVVQQG